MEISKITALWKLMTGGWAGLVVYILEALNKLLAKMDPTKLAQVAEVAKHIGNALAALIPLLPTKYHAAAGATLDAVNKLVAALGDAKVTEQELNDEIDAIEAAIEAWKSVK